MNKKTKLGIVMMAFGIMTYVPFAIISYSVASNSNTIAGMTSFLIGGYLFIAGEDLFKEKEEVK